MQNTAMAGYHISSQQLADYERDGYLIVRHLLDPNEVKEIRDRFDALGAAGKEIPGYWKPDLSPEAGGDPLKRYPRVMMPHRWDEMSKRYLLDPRLHDILAALFGEEPVAGQTMFYFKPPGAKGQALHQDNFYLHVKPATGLAAWIAIDPSTADNGGLYVVAGTHHEPIQCPKLADPTQSFTTHLVGLPDGKKAEPLALDSGDCLFFNGSVIHGSPPNRSKTQWRRSFICHYIPRGSTQCAKAYSPLLDFDGNVVPIPESQDGGPCGEEFEKVSISTYGKWH
jgi:ectoine hydroxylase-related dioxygenase (phytanoyl-CoA dioxygenase family)